MERLYDSISFLGAIYPIMPPEPGIGSRRQPGLKCFALPISKNTARCGVPIMPTFSGFRSPCSQPLSCKTFICNRRLRNSCASSLFIPFQFLILFHAISFKKAERRGDIIINYLTRLFVVQIRKKYWVL